MNKFAALHVDIPAIELNAIDELDIDRISIPQEQLDLANRYRTSLFPWRGQFSPELIEIFLNKYCNSSEALILDPFVGSGTTLFESARKQLSCFGCDINPAAITMAKSIHFINLPLRERNQLAQEALKIIERNLPHSKSHTSNSQISIDSFDFKLEKMLSSLPKDSIVSNLLQNAIIRFESAKQRSAENFVKAFNEHISIINSLPFSNLSCTAALCDARTLPLESQMVDLVITSPPYINVFNYHQNYRPSMELAGWNILSVAKSEFGSNRKHRSNRFFTAVQYSIDMFQALIEMRRVLKENGRLILVVGKTSTIRGVALENSRLLAALASDAGLKLVLRQQRRFTTRFGESIFEDILHFIPDHFATVQNDSFARAVATSLLQRAISSEVPNSILYEIQDAINEAPNIDASPVLDSSL